MFHFHRFLSLFFIPMLGALVLALFLGSCSQTNPEQNKFVIGIENDIKRLDPLTMKDPFTFKVGWQIYEGLISLDEEGEVIPKLAERWESSPDFTEWTFHIRKNVTFHESGIFAPQKSRELTAEDVVSSFTGYCSSTAYPAFMLTDSIVGCAAHNKGTSTQVDGLELVDRYTLKIKLTESEPFFLDRISSPWFGIFPREAVKAGDEWGETVAVGTGPFRLQVKNDTNVILEKNDTYWRSGYPKKHLLDFKVIKNDQVRLLELKKGSIDFMALPTGLLPEILDENTQLKREYEEQFTIKVVSGFNSHFLGINMQKIEDGHLRRALSLGVNRDSIAKNILRGLGSVNNGTIPLNYKGVLPETVKLLSTDSFNPEQAQEELKQSQYTGQNIELLLHDKERGEDIGAIIQSQLAEIGVRVKLVKLDYGSLLNRMLKGDTELFLFYADYMFSAPEPILFNMFLSSKIPIPNIWALDDKDIDKQILALRNLKDRQASRDESYMIQRNILEKNPAVFLFQKQNAYIYRKGMTNLKVNAFLHYMLEEAL